MPSPPEVALAIIIPTRNEAKNLPRLLESIRSSNFPSASVCVIDNHSTDKTLDIAASFEAVTGTKGPAQSAQRNYGSRLMSAANYFFFVDADMELEAGLLEEIAGLLANGAKLIVVPERSHATNYWGTVRTFERDHFAGDTSIEAARVFDRETFNALGGYVENMTGPEDWLLSHQASQRNEVYRTKCAIVHYDGDIRMRAQMRKYFKYGRGYFQLLRLDSKLFAEHANPARPSIRKNLRKIFANPRVASGLIVYKALTYLAGACGFTYALLSDLTRRK